MHILASLLAVVAASTAQAQEAPEVYLGDRMPDAAFDRLPATRVVVAGTRRAITAPYSAPVHRGGQP